jgi:hypothetical protein
MEGRIIAAIAGVIWLAALASAVVLVYAINRPAAVVPSGSPQAAAFTGASSLHPSADDDTFIGSSVLELPTITIVGTGVAEMQGKDEVIIGPGVVTHP